MNQSVVNDFRTNRGFYEQFDSDGQPYDAPADALSMFPFDYFSRSHLTGKHGPADEFDKSVVRTTDFKNIYRRFRKFRPDVSSVDARLIDKLRLLLSPDKRSEGGSYYVQGYSPSVRTIAVGSANLASASDIYLSVLSKLQATDGQVNDSDVDWMSLKRDTASSHFTNLGRGEIPAGFENIEQFEQMTFSSYDIAFEDHKFIASEKLLRIWVEGLNALRVESEMPKISVPIDKTDRSIYKELEREVDTVISNYARGKIYDYGGQSFKLTFNRRFYSPFETLVADYLVLPPRSSVIFLDELRELLVMQARQSPMFQRRWGSVSVDNAGDLLLNLNKVKARKSSDFFRK